MLKVDASFLRQESQRNWRIRTRIVVACRTRSVVECQVLGDGV